MLCSALEKFNENSFALVQCGYLLVNKKIVRKEPKQEFDIVEAKKNFRNVINLIDKKDQFILFVNWRKVTPFEVIP